MSSLEGLNDLAVTDDGCETKIITEQKMFKNTQNINGCVLGKAVC